MLPKCCHLFSAVVAGLAVALLLACGSGKGPAARSDAEGGDGGSTGTGAMAPDPLLNPDLAADQAPDLFKVKLETTKGAIVIEVHRDWAPHGVDRFFNLVKIGYFTDVSFFRVLDKFMAQCGIHGDPKVSAAWRTANIPDDPVIQSNTEGTVSFAKTSRPNSRSTQFFISYKDNSRLDAFGFAAFGKVIEGMDVARSLYSGYGEGAPKGSGPDQRRIQTEGNSYLEAQFPDLDYIRSAEITE